MLADSYGRVATDMRVSLTDRCNLRCAYCMPAEGLDWLPKPELLTDDEVVRLVRIGVERLGIREIRFTGGEPLLRRGLTGIVARTAGLRPRPELSITTNGIGLARTAQALRDACLDRVNVSLDTLRPEAFQELARRDRLAEVLDGMAAAAAAGLVPVKVNSVLMRGVNDERGRGPAAVLRSPRVRAAVHRADAAGRPARLAPGQHGHRRGDPHRAQRGVRAQARRLGRARLRPGGEVPGRWRPARVGVIGSVTRPFCGACDRVRLTADGQVRNCLFAREESDLRGPLRAGASDAELAARWRRAVAAKLPGHGINDPTFLQPDRPMSAIGG